MEFLRLRPAMSLRCRPLQAAKAASSCLVSSTRDPNPSAGSTAATGASFRHSAISCVTSVRSLAQHPRAFAPGVERNSHVLPPGMGTWHTTNASPVGHQNQADKQGLERQPGQFTAKWIAPARTRLCRALCFEASERHYTRQLDTTFRRDSGSGHGQIALHQCLRQLLPG
jgi:hypothetical protein